MIDEKLLQKDCFTEIIGQDKVKEQMKSILLSKRHAIIVGAPGIGKTTLAKSISKVLGKKSNFIRVQGSPDLAVEDILGDIDPIKALKFGPLSKEAFTKGKIFKADKGVLFFDELNRCPEKLQNALLQVLQEGYATIGSYDVDFPLDFVFIATMNPEDTNTEKLSDVLLDRFDFVYMDYPDTLEIENEIVIKYGEKIVDVDIKLLSFMTEFVRDLRNNKDIEKKPSVRASLGLYERTQAQAKLSGKDHATLEDLNKVVRSVIAHRIRLKPSVKYSKSPEEFVNEQFQYALKNTELGKELSKDEDIP